MAIQQQLCGRDYPYEGNRKLTVMLGILACWYVYEYICIFFDNSTNSRLLVLVKIIYIELFCHAGERSVDVRHFDYLVTNFWREKVLDLRTSAVIGQTNGMECSARVSSLLWGGTQGARY